MTARDLHGGGVRIQRVDAQRDAPAARPVSHHARDVAKAGAEIKDAVGALRPQPRSQEAPHEPMTAKAAVQRSQILQVPLQLGAYRLRAIHQLRLTGIEDSLHQEKNVGGGARARDYFGLSASSASIRPV